MKGPDYEQAFLDAVTRVFRHPEDDPTTAAENDKIEQQTSTTHLADVGRVTLKNIWQHPDTHPITLDLLLLRKFGPEWMLWSPETFELAIPHEFGVPASDLNLQKLHACLTLHATEGFWERWEVFTPCAMAFNGEFPDFVTMQVPTVAQCMVAADIAMRIRDDVAWSEEVKKFLGVVHLHDGILVPEPPLQFVHVEHDADVDLASIRARFPQVRTSQVAPTKETAEDEQLRRMLAVHQFLEESRERLRYQLRLISHA
jgi:hypothetical protein